MSPDTDPHPAGRCVTGVHSSDLNALAAELRATAEAMEERIVQRADRIAAVQVAAAREMYQAEVAQIRADADRERQRNTDLLDELRRQFAVTERFKVRYGNALLDLTNACREHVPDLPEPVRAAYSRARSVAPIQHFSEGDKA